MIFIRPIISTSAGLLHDCMVELWPCMNDLKLFFFDPSRDVAVATNAVGTIDLHSNLVVRMTFARAAPPAYDNKGSCYAGRKQQIT